MGVCPVSNDLADESLTDEVASFQPAAALSAFQAARSAQQPDSSNRKRKRPDVTARSDSMAQKPAVKRRHPLLSAHQPTTASAMQMAAVCRVDMSAAVAAALLPAATLSASVGAQPLSSSDPAAAPGQAGGAKPDAQPTSGQSRPAYLHGNYSRYYGYRLGDRREDPRVKAMQRHWIKGKRCLDIGCNSGVLTLDLVQRFMPASMLGVDIDVKLIKAACRALSARRSHAQALVSEANDAHLAHRPSEEGKPTRSQQRKTTAAAAQALAAAWFACEDFAASDHEAASRDTVTCFSVTKWVHLNQGDEGIRRLFQQVHKVLVLGGLFILEPQPWRSYGRAVRKKGISGAPFADLSLLHLLPEEFPAYLCSNFGFELLRDLQVEEGAEGFMRPMHVLRKMAN